MDKLLERLEEQDAEVADTLDRLMGDEELYLEYLKKFPENENMGNLRNAVECKDQKRAENEVHTLKGVALNLGLLPLADACMDMLLDFRSGKAERGFAQIDTVEEEFNKWVSLIQEV